MQEPHLAGKSRIDLWPSNLLAIKVRSALVSLMGECRVSCVVQVCSAVLAYISESLSSF